MTTLYYTLHDYIHTEEIINDIRRLNPERVVLLGEMEWEMTQATRELVQIATDNSVVLNIIHGCFKSAYHEEYYNSIGLPIDNVKFWGTHFFNHVYMHMNFRPEQRPSTYKPKQFKHKFISLNNRSHVHRCAFIEEMSKQNLLDDGVVTWIAHLNENADYPYQYFDGQKRLLSDGFAEHLDSYVLPDQWHESLFELVTESTPHIQFITEKTVRNLLLKKPFVILGAKGIHKTLTDLGFKLYDEVIDYSFDDIDDLHLRTEAYVNNIHSILRHDPQELYELLLPKLTHNYHRAMAIITDTTLLLHDTAGYEEGYNRLVEYQNAKKKVEYFSIWDYDPNRIFNIDECDTAIIDQTVEHDYKQLEGKPYGVDELITACNKYNVPAILLTSTKKYNPYELKVSEDSYTSIDSPGFWLSRAAFTSTVTEHYEASLARGIDIKNSRVLLDEPIQHLFISLNNRPHVHRCMTMDILAKHDLIGHGKISWRDVVPWLDDDRTDVPDSVRAKIYDYKYWQPTRLTLDIEDITNDYMRQEVLPTEYKNCFMQLVPESDSDKFFLTEKTAMALLHNMPFLAVGAQNFHANLVDMGFKLYDTMFDYSFDAASDLEERIEGVVNNINRYRNHTVEQLTQLRRDNEANILHNRNVALNYALNIVPNEFSIVQSMLSGQGIVTRLDNIYQLLERKDDLF